VRSELLCDYLLPVAVFFLYCYPIARATVALKSVRGEVMSWTPISRW